MENADVRRIADASLNVGRLILAFGRVERTTYHEDGILPETDTTHTVMLATLACAIASSYAKDLELGKVAQYAIIHDLVEAYAGDVSTLGGISDDAQKAKEEREHQALLRIKNEFDTVFPWIGSTIESYEDLKDPEARFVKTLDKLLPKITHRLNNGKAIEKHGMSKEELYAFREAQMSKLRSSYGYDQELILKIMSVFNSHRAE